jgi:hypothetical protein
MLRRPFLAPGPQHGFGGWPGTAPGDPDVVEGDLFVAPVHRDHPSHPIGSEPSEAPPPPDGGSQPSARRAASSFVASLRRGACAMAVLALGCAPDALRLTPGEVASGAVDVELALEGLPPSAYLLRRAGRLEVAPDLEVTVGPIRGAEVVPSGVPLRFRLTGQLTAGAHDLTVVAQGRTYRQTAALQAVPLFDAGWGLDADTPADAAPGDGGDIGDAEPPDADGAAPRDAGDAGDAGGDDALYVSLGPHEPADFRPSPGGPWSFGPEVITSVAPSCSGTSLALVEAGFGAGWTDVVFSARFRIADGCGGNAALGLFVRAQDRPATCDDLETYFCRVARRRISVGDVRAGCGPAARSEAVSSISELTAGVWYELAVEAVGDTVSCVLSGGDLSEPVRLEKVGGNPPRLDRGSVGLLVEDQTVDFDDLRVLRR